MSKQGVFQNIVLLVVATGLAVYFRSAWSFTLLIFWLAPADAPKPKSKKGKTK